MAANPAIMRFNLVVGANGLGVDRLSRRIGFRRTAEAQWSVLDADVRALLEGYAAGVTAGARRGGRS